MSGLRVHIADDWMAAGIGVIFAYDTDVDRIVWAPGGDERARYVHGDPSPTAGTIEPLRLTADEGRALMQALIRHYDGGEDTRSLRRDYDAERSRADRLINALIALVADTA